MTEREVFFDSGRFGSFNQAYSRTWHVKVRQPYQVPLVLKVDISIDSSYPAQGWCHTFVWANGWQPVISPRRW